MNNAEREHATVTSYAPLSVETAIALWVGLATLLLHAAIIAAVGFDGYFVKYHIAAQQLIEGTLLPIRQMDLSPLYFEFTVLIERLFSGNDLAVVPMHWAQRMLVACSASLLYVVLRARLPRGWALVGVAIFSIEPHVLVYERIFEPEIVLVTALLGCIVAVERKSLFAAVVAGSFASAAIATRPTFLLLFFGLAPLYYFLQGMRGRSLVTRSIGFLLPVVLCGVLLGFRAQSITGDWSTPVMNPGTVFFEGTQPLSRGTSAAYPPIVASMIVINPNVPDEAHNHYRRVAREDLRRNVTIADVNAYWAGKAMAFIYAEPIRYVERVVDKATRILRDDRAHDIGTAREYESALPSFRGFYAALSALALVGAVSQIRRIRRDLFLYAFALVQIAVMLVFYVSARQQMVLVVPLVFFACAGLHAMASHRAVAVAGGVAAVLLWLVLMGRSDLTLDDAHRTKGGEQAQRLAEEVASLPASEPIASHPDLAAGVLAAASWVADENAMGNVGQERATQYQAAVAILKEKTPRDFFDEFDLATLELEAGDLPAARERFRALAEMGRLPYRGHWQASSPLFYLGRIAGLEGRNDAAIDYLTRALRETPGDPFVLAELTALDGAPHWRELSDRYYSALDTQLLVAEAMLVQGRAPEAVTDFAKLARSLPRLHRANVGLAASYGAVGEFEKGVEVYRRSLRVNSNPVIWSERISTLFRGWARENRDDPAVQFEAARMLFFHGRFEEALGLVAVLAPVGGGAVEPAIANFEQNVRRTLAVIPD